MKNTKLAVSALAIALLTGSFAAQARQGNGDENVQTTQSYQAFVQHQEQRGEVQGDSSTFVNHDSNR